jgi:hypothetical protein
MMSTLTFAHQKTTVQLAHGGPERCQRPAVARTVPHACRDSPAGPGRPVHLPQALHRVSHEMNDQLRQRGAERAVGKRQVLGGRLPDIHSWQPFPHRGPPHELHIVTGADIKAHLGQPTRRHTTPGVLTLMPPWARSGEQAAG